MMLKQTSRSITKSEQNKGKLYRRQNTTDLRSVFVSRSEIDYYQVQLLRLPESNYWIKSTLYLLQRPPFCFYNITSYVHDSKKTDGWKSQIDGADTKLVYNT